MVASPPSNQDFKESMTASQAQVRQEQASSTSNYRQVLEGISKYKQSQAIYYKQVQASTTSTSKYRHVQASIIKYNQVQANKSNQ